ncbi:potassium channel family protein, partial [Thiolapillus sp.]
HSLWWAVVTLTTVGYGDIYPVTVGGRIFTFIVLMVGLGIVAVPAGLVASALSQAHSEENTDKVEKDEI